MQHLLTGLHSPPPSPSISCQKGLLKGRLWLHHSPAQSLWWRPHPFSKASHILRPTSTSTLSYCPLIFLSGSSPKVEPPNHAGTQAALCFPAAMPFFILFLLSILAHWNPDNSTPSKSFCLLTPHNWAYYFLINQTCSEISVWLALQLFEFIPTSHTRPRVFSGQR